MKWTHDTPSDCASRRCKCFDTCNRCSVQCQMHRRTFVYACKCGHARDNGHAQGMLCTLSELYTHVCKHADMCICMQILMVAVHLTHGIPEHDSPANTAPVTTSLTLLLSIRHSDSFFCLKVHRKKWPVHPCMQACFTECSKIPEAAQAKVHALTCIFLQEKSLGQ